MASKYDPLTLEEQYSIENGDPIPVGTVVRLTNLGHKYYDTGDGSRPRGRMVRGRVVEVSDDKVHKPLNGVYVEVLEPVDYFANSIQAFHLGALAPDDFSIRELP